ncbi:2Fe-2S iron-sulfur cluster-binding protein [Methylocystis sp. MJC1]|jgi:2Fe-2S ferredoxin|uniref:2Fe-2S iron-sulfur cluster-binding protein n=1 Tax=Methylocystis sp. MJC1 TaxID=2654282 RepID=UPI001FED7B65|nr:2Fe-2S iron-sulfur cluster-binding protein [Methylocystis sp. MJC1]KAF2990576.1 Rhodocoxin [Methylocystis sp. MJC1]UZX12230.1 2Fe-2S iron-sulfur cluster-binding protein [Methylocystis sp. MJC1]
MSIALDIAVDPSPVPLEPEAPILRVEDRNGVVHELAAVEGWRLMEILRDYGIGMENTCGGALACAECHVVLDAESAARVPPPRDDELEKLDELPMLYENSRLACQIIWSDEMSGLSLKLAQET